MHGRWRKIRVIVDNLLSQRDKYSPAEGEIIVRLGRYKDNATVIRNGRSNLAPAR